MAMCDTRDVTPDYIPIITCTPFNHERRLALRFFSSQTPLHTMEDTPLNAAHAFANAAEEAEEREQWKRAMENHFLAAEQFSLATSYTSDPEAVRTLRLLYINHNQKGKDIQRRLSKIPAQPASRPPEPLQYRRDTATTATAKSPRSQSRTAPTSLRNPAADPQAYLASDGTVDDVALQGTRRGQASLTSALMTLTMQGGSAEQHSDESSPSGSSDKIDESYMVLKGDDDADPFNKFWEMVEDLVQKLSNPAVAFTTVPLNVDDPLYGMGNFASRRPGAVAEATPQITAQSEALGRSVDSDRHVVAKKADGADHATAAMMESYFVVPDRPTLFDKMARKPSSVVTLTDKSSSRRSGLVDAAAAPVDPNKTREEYAMENQQLKIMIDQLSRRLMTVEKTAEEAKSSIIQFRQDVQKQAKRIMQSQDLMRSSVAMGPRYLPGQPVTPGTPGTPGAPWTLQSVEGMAPSTSALQKKVKDLEDEVRVLKEENKKQQEQMNKYRERWDKLKESAKKRRNVKIQAASDETTAAGEVDAASAKLAAAAARPPIATLPAATLSIPTSHSAPLPNSSSRPSLTSSAGATAYLPARSYALQQTADSSAQLPPFAAQPVSTSPTGSSLPLVPQVSTPPSSIKARLRELQHPVTTEDGISVRGYSAGAVAGLTKSDEDKIV